MTLAAQVQLEQFDMPHPSGERTFRITVWQPDPAAAADADLPVLFVLDADMTAGLAGEIAKLHGTGGKPTAMVVGIGYGVADFALFAKLRTADLTPPLSAAGRAAMGAMSDFVGDKDGGADAFLTFLTGTLAPAIGERYPCASTTSHTLFGHSLGGLFTAYALLTRPQAFAGFVANSPSLWWDGFAILQRLPAFAGHLAALEHKPRVLIGVGGKEQDVPAAVPPGLTMELAEVQALVAASRMVDAAIEFAEQLRSAGLTDTVDVVFADEDHGSVIPAALSRAVGLAVAAKR